MSGNGVQRVQGNPAAYTVPSTGVGTGAIVADDQGANPGASIVLNTSPTVKVAFPLVLGGDSQRDAFTLVESSSGAGVRSLQWTIRTAAGVARAGVGVVLALGSEEPMTVALNEGVVLLVGNANNVHVNGVADGAGVLGVTVTAPSATEITWVLSDISSNPRSQFGATVIP